MKILLTGASGLVGSRVSELFKDTFELDSLKADITTRQAFDEVIASDSDILLHLAAKTNVDLCEQDKQTDLKLSRDANLVGCKTAWAVNVFGTDNLAKACFLSNKKIVYISTDFVFNGTKKFYTEKDSPDPINWYGQTKYEGEKIVSGMKIPWLILRLSYPYRAKFVKTDFIRTLIKKMENGERLSMVTDHIIRPTFIDDLAQSLRVLLEKKSSGIFHVTGSQSVTPYDAALMAAEIFGLNKNLIDKTTREQYFKGRAKRGFCLVLKNDKIGKLGCQTHSLRQGLSIIKKQLQ